MALACRLYVPCTDRSTQQGYITLDFFFKFHLLTYEIREIRSDNRETGAALKFKYFQRSAQANDP